MIDTVQRLMTLEADVMYQEPPSDEDDREFGYKAGCLPILLSAPHSAVHTRCGKLKEEDEYTAGIARLVSGKSGAHVMWLRRRSDEDANWDHQSHYKEVLADIVQKNGIWFVLDIHGAAATRPFDIAVGTANGKSCSEVAENLIVSTLRDRGLVVEVNPYGFQAAGEGTVTYFARNALRISAVQLELNAHLRVPQRRSDASDSEPFTSRDPKLIVAAVESLTTVVQQLATGA